MAFTNNLGYRDSFDILSNTKLRVKNTNYESYISENLTLIFWPANWDYWVRKSVNYYD